MPTNKDLSKPKKQIEALTGKIVDLTPEQIIVLRFPIGMHDVSSGTVASTTIFVPQRKSCASSPLLDASGAVVTGASGNVTFLLSSKICLPVLRDLQEPVNLVATAHGATPIFVTTTHAFVAGDDIQGRNDLQITVFAWDANGNPAPNIVVHWRCRLVSISVIL